LHHTVEAVAPTAADGNPDAAVPGPFAQPLNALFAEAFGESLHSVEVTRDASPLHGMLATPAFTVGSHIFLGPDVAEDPSDSFGMDVLTHEVAHALARPGPTEQLLDDPWNDPGEAGAREAGRAMSRAAQSGWQDGAPSLTPAHGGQAAVQRWGSGEHMDAVDLAMQNLGPVRPDGSEVDPAVAAMLDPNRRIRMGNGVELTAGEVTALMGDFYGAFDEGEDGKQHFNPQRSFEQLWNADPEEMSSLAALVRRDAAAKRGEEGAAEVGEEEWEAVTSRRDPSQRSYLELAEVNDSHFSAGTMEGVDNNMGVYSIFHQMALEEASRGGEANVDMMRALEASSMHYLTDRHASGHAFNKAGVMEAGGWTDTTGNLAAKIVHDSYNAGGIDATSAEGTGSWRAYGDSHWNDDANAENRTRTAESVYRSWGELAEVMGGGGRSAEEIQDQGYSAYGSVPEFSAERQRSAEQQAADSVGILDKLGLIGEEIGLAGPMAERWIFKNVETPAVEAADWANDNIVTPVGEGIDKVSGWGEENILNPAGRAIDSAGETLSEGADEFWRWIND